MIEIKRIRDETRYEEALQEVDALFDAERCQCVLDTTPGIGPAIFDAGPGSHA
jgi:antitoxin component HigA of HigAB toxin-antitoxin module